MASVKKRIAILISGRGSNMEAILKEARDGILMDCCQVVVVVSNRCDAPGLTIAQNMGVETICVESNGKTRIAFGRQLLDSGRQPCGLPQLCAGLRLWRYGQRPFLDQR